MTAATGEVHYDHSVTWIRARKPADSTRPSAATHRIAALVAVCVVSLPSLAAAPGEAVDLEAPVIELVPPDGPALGLATVMALACDENIREVGFWVNGRFVGADDSPPFEIEADFGAVFEPHTVRARAVDRHQVVVGETSLELNAGDVELVTEIEHTDSRIALTAAAPPGSPPPVAYRVYAGGRELAHQTRADLDLSMPLDGLGGADIVRVAAEYDDGSSLDRYLLVRQGFSEAVDVNEVQLWVTVTDRDGEPVLDLAPDSFSVRSDDWSDEEPVIVRPEDEPLTLAVILDGSDSMSGFRDTLRKSTETLATELLGDDDRLFLFDVSDRPRLLNPAGDPAAAVERLDDLVDGGGSALYDSLYFGLRRLATMEGRKALVMLSDGADLHSYLDTERVADLAWRRGIPVFLVASEMPHRSVDRLRAYNLRRFVESTGGRVFLSGSTQGQRRAIETILTLLRNPYVVPLTGDAEWDLAQLREVQVELPDPKMEARVFLGRDG